MTLARRIGLLVVVAGIVIGARLLSHRSIDVDLALELGPRASEVRAVDLVFTDERDHVERELALRYPSGAPERDRRRVRLHQGSYSVGVRLESAGAARSLGRTLRVDEAGTYALDLAGP